MDEWRGFHRLSPDDRMMCVQRHAGLSDEDTAILRAASALPFESSDAFIENAVGCFPVPLGFAVNLLVDGDDIVIPMAVEESSVVAAASHGAKLARHAGGFSTEAMPPVSIGQIEIRAVADPEAAAERAMDQRDAWMQGLNSMIPTMVQRGGGVVDIAASTVGADRVVVQLHVDTREAMGANTVNTLCEFLADEAVDAVGGRKGVRIISNLATKRLAMARCKVPYHVLGGQDIVESMVEANDFARLDPFRAATHNKGIMNGIDPVCLATGNDWRAVEAAAHAYAGLRGRYQALTQYRQNEEGDLEAQITLPVPVGTVGGVISKHPVARACRRVMGNPDSVRLSRILAAVGLAQNLAALRALSDEGIQRGHMSLHAANDAITL